MTYRQALAKLFSNDAEKEKCAEWMRETRKTRPDSTYRSLVIAYVDEVLMG